MSKFDRGELESAIPVIESMISRSVNVQGKLKEESSQASLTKNRLKALNLSLALIHRELKEDYDMEKPTEDVLKNALPPIISTIGKCTKIELKSKEGTSQATLTRNMLKALYLSSSLITAELDKRQ